MSASTNATDLALLARVLGHAITTRQREAFGEMSDALDKSPSLTLSQAQRAWVRKTIRAHEPTYETLAMMVDTFELPWLAGREDVVALLARAVSCLPRMMRGLKARTRVHAPGRMAIDSPWARAIDLFLGASILGARSLRLTRGWWELKRLPVPAVFDYGFALSPEDDGYGWHEYLIRHVRHGFGGEVVTLYQDRGNPRVRGERTRNGPMRELPHLRQIEFDRERGRIVEALASFGGDVPKTKDELLDAAKVAPNEWSRAMFALAMAMRDEHR